MTVSWIGVAACIGGCRLPEHSTARLYSGKARPQAQVARMYNTDKIGILDVDGKRVHTMFRWANTPGYIYELEAGHHRVKVGRIRTAYEIIDAPDLTAAFEYDFLPARTYSFVLFETFDPSRYQWTVKLADYESGEILAEPTVPPDLNWRR